MGKRFVILIGVAAVGVMALGAQTAAEAPGVVEYNTKLTITTDRGFLIHGFVLSDRDRNPRYDPAKKVRECMDGREVILFKQRLGADLMLATAQSQFIPRYGRGDWGVPGAVGKGPARHHARVYAKVTPKVGDGFVCRGDRSATICTGWFPDCRKALSAASGGAPVRGFRLTK